MPIEGLSLERIDDRMKLLANFDRFQRDMDRSGAMDAIDLFSQQALQILASGKLAQALDLEREPESVLQHYSPVLANSGIQSTTSETCIPPRNCCWLADWLKPVCVVSVYRLATLIRIRRTFHACAI